MIVQTAQPGEPHFVVLMRDHTKFAGQMARAFGNDAFEALAPREEMLFIVNHHDSGWAAWDESPKLDPETALPYNLSRTPMDDLLRTSTGSPDFNEAHHPYCGLVSSMHSWGLYNGRYGLSKHKVIDAIPPAARPKAQAMLDGELARQERLRKQLAKDPQASAWVEMSHLMQNYKQLQFFDTLALYFNMAHEDARARAVFQNVPRTARDDVEVTIEPAGHGAYDMHPFPFAGDVLELSCRGYYLAPLGEGADLGAALRKAPLTSQTFRVRRA